MASRASETATDAAGPGRSQDDDRPDALRVTFVDQGPQDLGVHHGGSLDLDTAPHLDERIRDRLCRSV